MLKAKDIMKRDVITVSPETTVEELGRLFIEKGISGAPVVDSGRKLVGVVTENDLISQNKRLHIPTILRLFDAFIPLESTSTIEKEIKKMSASTVAEICTKDVVTIDEETSVQDIATVMTEKRIHLLPILKEGKVIGIIGKHEVIKGMSGEASEQMP